MCLVYVHNKWKNRPLNSCLKLPQTDTVNTIVLAAHDALQQTPSSEPSNLSTTPPLPGNPQGICRIHRTRCWSPTFLSVFQSAFLQFIYIIFNIQIIPSEQPFNILCLPFKSETRMLQNFLYRSYEGCPECIGPI